jgi:lysophospholipase L1-like esterase
LGRDIAEASGPADAFNFVSQGIDPMIISPFFEAVPVRLGQWMEICMRTDMSGGGEIYWSSRRETRYGGFTPGQRIPITLRPGPDFRIYRVIPRWERDPEIIRLRFDPPSGGPGSFSIRWLRIYEAAASSSDDAPDQPEFWVAGGADIAVDSWPVTLGGPTGSEVLLSSPFRPSLGQRAYMAIELDADEDSELSVTILGEGFTLPGMERIPIWQNAGRCRANVQIPTPPQLREGRACLVLDTLAGYGGAIRVHSVAISPDPAGPPVLLVEEAGIRGNVFARAGDSLTAYARVRNWGGRTANHVVLSAEAPEPVQIRPTGVAAVADVLPGRTAEWEWSVRSLLAGEYSLTLTVSGEEIVRRIEGEESLRDTQRVAGSGGESRIPLRFHDRPPAVRMGRIPEPEPVAADYEVGVYYFPRWYEKKNWEVLLSFPERKPLLGWYVDLAPEVADWHISWCAASGISFFIYDWYWEQGRRQLYGALEEGYLHAQYRPHLRFCLLWANHNRPNTHSREDLLEVTRFWIEHYFRLPEYYTIDGRPVVVIFAPNNIVHDLGGEEAVREAFQAMREECRARGIPPIYLVACGPGGERTQESFAAQGYDASSGYNYPGISGKGSTGDGYEAQIEGYLELWEQAAGADALPHIPVLSGGWDSRPWHGARARVRPGRTPELFRRHCLDAKRFLDNVSPRNKRVLFIEAWNEWGEGSYIEPHAEFEFDYLHAIRDVFTKGESEWQPLLPSDVGLSVPLVRGVEQPTVEPTDPPSWSVRIPKGEWKVRGPTFRINEDLVLPVEPAPVVEVKDEKHVLRDDPPQKWRGGTSLAGSVGPSSPTRLPFALDPASLAVRGGTGEETTIYREGEDYVFEPEYGGIARKPEGSIPKGATVLASYRHFLARIDAVDLLPGGEVVVRQGMPAKACPLPPSTLSGAVRLAHIHLPFRCDGINEGNVYRVPPGGEGRVDDAPLFYTGEEFLKGTRGKLHDGKPITVVFLGDSVTVGGDASSPEMSFVGRFEAGIRSRFPAVDVKIVNAGVGGTNSDYGLERLERDALVHRPDLVVVEFVNDMGFPASKIRKNYQRLIKQMRESGSAECILLTPHYKRPAWMPGFAEAAQAMRDVAFEEKAALGDVSASWEALGRIGVPYESLLANGINHPDDRGHRIYADVLLALVGN